MKCFDNANLRASCASKWRAECVKTAAVLVLAVVFVVSGSLPVLHAVANAQATVKAAFGDDCEALVIKELAGARKEVLVAIYSLTRRKVNSALAKAAARGAKVTVKYDAGQAEQQAMKDSLAYLKDHGVKCQPVKMSEDYAAMHHKFIVVDRRLVLTGSCNYTVPATELNYENIVSIDSAEVAGAFEREFERIKDR